MDQPSTVAGRVSRWTLNIAVLIGALSTTHDIYADASELFGGYSGLILSVTWVVSCLNSLLPLMGYDIGSDRRPQLLSAYFVSQAILLDIGFCVSAVMGLWIPCVLLGLLGLIFTKLSILALKSMKEQGSTISDDNDSSQMGRRAARQTIPLVVGLVVLANCVMYLQMRGSLSRRDAFLIGIGAICILSFLGMVRLALVSSRHRNRRSGIIWNAVLHDERIGQ